MNRRVNPEEISCSWDVENSEFGEGTIEAKVRVTDCSPLVDLTMRWRGCHKQPELWEITWCHHPDFLLSELPAYLLRCCPVGAEMVKVLQSLGLENFPTQDELEEVPKNQVKTVPPSMSRAGKAESILARLRANGRIKEGNEN